MNNLLKIVKKYPKYSDAMFIIFGFVAGGNLFIFFKQSGIDEFNPSYLEERGFHFATPTIAGIVIGAALFLLEFKFFKRLNPYRRSWVILLKIIIVSSVIVATSLVIQSTVSILFFQNSISSAFLKSLNFIKTDIFFSLYIYLIILAVTLNFIRELGNRFGHGIIIDYLSGKYRDPMEEDRIFMFLDMNESTSYAEQLGHVKYSRLLNRCFILLDSILIKYDAEVYQFVGDEAVLTWAQKDFIRPDSPILLFREYEELLKVNSYEFKEIFRVQPSFKASIHAGSVVVTELGGKKRDLAYHGDVLNTTARILELCKKYRKSILVTKAYLDKLDSDFFREYLTTIALRGKTEKIDIFAVK